MRLTPLLLGAALLAAGCTTVTRPPGPPPLTPSPSIAPNFDVPSVRARMVFLAQQEWELFGRGVVVREADGTARVAFPANATHEAQPAMLSRVLMYWYAVTRAPIVGQPGRTRALVGGVRLVARAERGHSAGGVPAHGPALGLHRTVPRARATARGSSRAIRSASRRASGDLVCVSRSGTVTDFASLGRGAYHCDLVVSANAGGIEVVGGNVGDTVALARFPLDERGLLLARDDRPWVAVIEQRDPR